MSIALSQTVPQSFWGQIDHQLRRIALERPSTFEALAAILDDPAYDQLVGPFTQRSGQSFFAGSGGDETLLGALLSAGWRLEEYEAEYHYSVVNTATGEQITYIEGDVEPGGIAL